jgi:hypothetical protein
LVYSSLIHKLLVFISTSDENQIRLAIGRCSHAPYIQRAINQKPLCLKGE